MAEITYYDSMGVGAYLRSGNFSVSPSEVELIDDNNPSVDYYDFDTLLVSGSFNNGAVYYGFYLDIVSDEIVEIDSFYFFDSEINIMASFYDINISANIYDDFTAGATFTNILAANDEISGNRYSDHLEAGNGNDLVYGNGGNDLLYGQNGNDKLYGGNSNDKLYGGANNDTLRGDSGNDSLQGDAGKDSLTGGSGTDSFIFRSVSESATGATTADVITDFVSGTDKINLSAIDAFAGTSANDTFIWKGTSGFNSTTKGEVRYEKFNNSGTANDYTMVWIDNDRDSGVEMAIRLTGLHNLTASDFVL